jgi:hypothetical protein
MGNSLHIPIFTTGSARVIYGARVNERACFPRGGAGRDSVWSTAGRLISRTRGPYFSSLVAISGMRQG